LLVSGLRLLIQHRSYDENMRRYKKMPLWLGTATGGVLGFLSGVTGIGGGIFLSPVLYNLRVGSPRQIACASSLFILLNSISGLAGQLQKHAFSSMVTEYWYLPLLALLGGQAGNLLMLKFMPPRMAALLTALLVLFVAGQLGLRILNEG
ncbi:MAG: sulfite exporter TauE/SafE family protein, partial [Alphaproteobacteria bacterium]|nr:sulfite exporter TauE/SafE family protein [Alphaproteobacteria bacterium]